MQVGMVVVLKSGGPHMTVHYIQNEVAFCKWFLENGEIRSEKFNIYMLKIVDND